MPLITIRIDCVDLTKTMGDLFDATVVQLTWVTLAEYALMTYTRPDNTREGDDVLSNAFWGFAHDYYFRLFQENKFPLVVDAEDGQLVHTDLYFKLLSVLYKEYYTGLASILHEISQTLSPRRIVNAQLTGPNSATVNLFVEVQHLIAQESVYEPYRDYPL